MNPLTYLLTYLHGLFKEPIIGPLKSKMAEIRYLENRHDVIFFCWGWSDLDKISQTGAEWHVDCGDVVKIETRCRIPIWRIFGRIPWHVMPEPRITLHCSAIWWIHCHDSRATCHIAGCSHLPKSMSWSCYNQGVIIASAILKIVFRHILFYFVFFNAVWVLTSGGFRIVSDTLVYDRKPQSYAQDNKTKFNCTHNFIHQSMADTKYSKLDG